MKRSEYWLKYRSQLDPQILLTIVVAKNRKNKTKEEGDNQEILDACVSEHDKSLVNAMSANTKPKLGSCQMLNYNKNSRRPTTTNNKKANK